MKRKYSLVLGTVLLTIAAVFVTYAVHHPESSFPWSNRITFIIYGVYTALIIKFLLEIPLSGRNQQVCKDTSAVFIKTFLYSILAIIFLIMLLTSESANIYTALQALIVFESCDLARENLLRYLKMRKSRIDK